MPGPAGGGGADQVETKKNEPKIEPRRTVDIGPGHAGTETRLKKGGGGTNAGQRDEEQHGKVQRAQGMDSPPDGRPSTTGGDHLFPGFVQGHPKRIGRTGRRTRSGEDEWN